MTNIPTFSQVFRDQEFIDQPPEKQLEFGSFFGRLHIHPTSGQPKEFPHFHLVYRDNVSVMHLDKVGFARPTNLKN